jgi:hypothetical protein
MTDPRFFDPLPAEACPFVVHAIHKIQVHAPLVLRDLNMGWAVADFC